MNRDLIRAAFTGTNLIGFAVFLNALAIIAAAWSMMP